MLKVGVIGAGYWGPNLIRNFYDLGCLYLICDKDEKRLEYMHKKYPNVKITKDVDEAISLCDAIVIATTASSHYELAKKSLLTGKSVFVEKPMVFLSSYAKELNDIANKMNKVLMVGHILLYHSTVRKIKEYINNGELGKIYYIYSQRLSLGKIRSDENVLWSFGPHDVSMILYLLDSLPKKVSATGKSFLQKGILDIVFLTLYFDDVIAHIHLSWLSPRKIRQLTIVGSNKSIEMDDMMPAEKIRVYDKSIDYEPTFKPYGESFIVRSGDIIIPNIELKEPLREECEHFIDCVINGKKPLSDGENGFKVVYILEVAQKSIELGGKALDLTW